ncbi:MAG: sulfatase, partial [Alphaproteobacteria bacterium]|nr:sulfatase [Alphaproteobacteria bacterium]
TLLGYFGVGPTPDMLGCDLARCLADDTPVREAAIFGQFGAHVNVTDGRYLLMAGHAADQQDTPRYEYTAMPARMRRRFTVDELRAVEGLAEPFAFAKDCPTMRIGRLDGPPVFAMASRLFNLEQDPGQSRPIDDPEIERRMRDHLARLMQQCDAPPEQFKRLGLASEPAVTEP